jgi:hypothetical protein
MNIQLEVDGKPVRSVSASGSPGTARLLADCEPVADEATITITARLLAETLVAYAQSGANGLYAAQVGAAAKRLVQAKANAVLYAAAAAVAARRR